MLFLEKSQPFGANKRMGMKNIIISVALKVLCTFSLCVPSLAFNATQSSPPFELKPITHATTKEEPLTHQTLREIYTLRTQSWPNGEPLTVFVMADDSDVHQAFCAEVLGILAYHLRRNWDRLIFSGRAASPIEVATEEEMKLRVAATPGSIGYLRTKDVDETVTIVEVK